MRAWCAGEDEHCLRLCDLVERRCAALALEVGVLRARALLRLDRAQDALRALEPQTPPGATDSPLSARLLRGAALVRLGRIDEGLAVLERAQSDAAAGGAHSTLRSEIALHRGLAHYGRRELDAAQAALGEVADDADVVHAAGLNRAAWVQAARGRYAAAIELFVASLRRLDGCRRCDRPLEANGLQTLSAFAVERLDRSLWQFVETRAARLDGGPPEPRFWLGMAACYMEELEGRDAAAVRAARLAEELAPSSAYRVLARLRRAAISRLLGERASQLDHATSAREMFEGLRPETLGGDETNVALTLAEELAHAGAVGDARRALATYRAHPVSPLHWSSGDRGMRAYERLVEAHIAEAAGDRVEAHHAFRDAFQVFRSTGCRRRAITAALRLAEIAEQPYLYDYVTGQLGEFSRASWFHRHVAAKLHRPGSVPAAPPAGTQPEGTSSVPIPASAAPIAP